MFKLSLSFILIVVVQAVLAAANPVSSEVNADWPVYLGGPQRNLYSPLTQIDRENVAQLEPAWTFDTGDKGEYQANNLVVGGVLYTATPSRKVIALDAATGREKWRWNPATTLAGAGAPRQRGLVYWRDAHGGEARLFTAAGNFLFALDAQNGELIPSFGEKGAVDLGRGLEVGAVPKVGLNTPGVVYRDLLILGGNGGPGAVRALDVRTGEQRWIFHLIPRPGELGYDTWPKDAYKSATGLMPWSGQALDEARGIVYVATKTAGPDFYGGSRPGQNLFANSLVALDAATGRYLWHDQIVHHDLLDRDLPCAPVLLTVTHEGRKIDAVAQGTKQGLLFVFDRVTGKPLWPIEERAVPASDLRGEQTWTTQPFPTKPAPLIRQRYSEADASTLSSEAREMTLDGIRRSPNFGPFPAPSLKETVMFPGFDGGMEWGGGAADPDGIYYVNLNEIPWKLQMVETGGKNVKAETPGARGYLIHCAACHGLDRAGNSAGGFPSLVELGRRRTRAQAERIVRQGSGRMPAFDGLAASSREAILDYLFGHEVRRSASRDEVPGSISTEAGDTEPYAFSGFKRWTDREGYPAIKPPWGTLVAVDLNTGELKWRVPLGEYPALTARGIPPTGTENYGGPVVTAGGLIFIAATADETIRAFDKETGRLLWQHRLPFGGNATPSIYAVKGREFLVISAGGGKSGRPAGGSLVAFALPLPPPSTAISP